MENTKKTILGLDLGTNSIGWALVEQDYEKKEGKILGMGSRIIPMSQDVKDDFGKGNSISQTAERTTYRGARRLRERHLLRRERLHRILNILGFLPEHYSKEIDFTKRLGKFLDETEPKIAWKKNEFSKFEFIFQSSFDEMLSEFKANGYTNKIPYDWTLFYLRKKALEKAITKEELSWIILNFNQKRGYYQLRGEDDNDSSKTAKTRKYFERQIIKDIYDSSEIYKGLKVLIVELENGSKGKIFKKAIPQWIGSERNIIVTVDIDKEGNDKYDDNGLLSQRFSIPTDAEWESEWKLIKLKTERDLHDSEKTVGVFIYDSLINNQKQKIKGKLVRTIERKYYKEELMQILKKQIALQPNLFNTEIYSDCVRELYRNNDSHQLSLGKKDFIHLILNDIIFYQRPLRSQKSSIGNCTLEKRPTKDSNKNIIKNEKGKAILYPLKAIAKSHPLYQEYRLWQWIFNLSIFKKEDDTNCTINFIKDQKDYENLFEYLHNRNEIKQDILIKYLLEKNGLKGKDLKEGITKFRWNFVEDKIYPTNETGTQIRSRLSKTLNVPDDFLSQDKEIKLWHIIYSVTDKTEYEKALRTYANKNKLDEASFVENFINIKPFASEYGSFSEKAIKKLLPLMRIGKYWNYNAIDETTKKRINKLINGEFDETIKNRIREKAIYLTKESDFQGLQLWLAQYIVYNRHSEAETNDKWTNSIDLDKYLKEFKQHSLRNPIVEQVITETLRVVKDIWNQYGKGSKDYFKEIHIELGREMKNTAEERKHISNKVTENENTNFRIKALLNEMVNDKQFENVRPNSPMHQEALKIYEDYAINNQERFDEINKSYIYEEIPEDILKISKTAQPNKIELQRYTLWLEQKYRSPYTGEIIPLSKLFTTEYEIEHIIPQSRYFDDSFSNKVICESAVNKLKDKQLGFEFIKNHHGTIIETGYGKSVKILDESSYQEFVIEHYSKVRSKRLKLLLEEIPDKMVERQLNDTRYISKFISSLLSNIVRDDKNDEGVNSKNIIPGNGKITSILRHDWGLNDVWNELILPRFLRMNQITKTDDFTAKNKEGHYIPTVPLELSKGFQKKRIDHRHHALDALVIACATRDHINLLNNQSAKSENNRSDLQNKLRNKVKWTDKNGIERTKFTEFKMPWIKFTVEAKNKLDNIVISFKQNLRVINKTTNKYEIIQIVNGKKIKENIPQSKGASWAIRKPMHKETVYGIVKLDRIKLQKGKILTATRKKIDQSFDLKTIETITDTGIQKILKNYLASKANNPELAFSPEGIEDLNTNIEIYNDGKKHQPIFKARVFEMGSKFILGQTGNKKKKYVEAAKGTNLFFAVYQDTSGKRIFDSIPLNIIIERQKQGLYSVPELNEKGQKLLFHLSPNDLVYVPTEDELINIETLDYNNLTKKQENRIYKMVSCTGNECHFIPANNATLIKNYDPKSKIGELGSLNKLETTTSVDNIRIKEMCLKLKVDRLGKVTNV